MPPVAVIETEPFVNVEQEGFVGCNAIVIGGV
jgi:hypothetical protein